MKTCPRVLACAGFFPALRSALPLGCNAAATTSSLSPLNSWQCSGVSSQLHFRTCWAWLLQLTTHPDSAIVHFRTFSAHNCVKLSSDNKNESELPISFGTGHACHQADHELSLTNHTNWSVSKKLNLAILCLPHTLSAFYYSEPVLKV